MPSKQRGSWTDPKSWLMGILASLIVAGISSLATWLLKPGPEPCIARLSEQVQELSDEDLIFLVGTLPDTGFPIDSRLPGSERTLNTVRRLVHAGLFQLTNENMKKPAPLRDFEYVAGPTLDGNAAIEGLRRCVLDRN